MAQCAFEVLVFKISAVHTIYRSWLRSSSIYEPSDPPIRLENYVIKKLKMGCFAGGAKAGGSLSLTITKTMCRFSSTQSRTKSLQLLRET